MTEAVKAMNDLGFIDTTDKHDRYLVRQFKKFDDKGCVTNTINFFYGKESGIQVFTNDIKNQCGTRLDNDLLVAIILNIIDLEKELEK